MTTTQTQTHGTIELYWMPGCSACLRAKEFLETSGLAYEAVNVDDRPQLLADLRAGGVQIPAIRRDGEYANAVRLTTIAEFLGIDYTPPIMLSPADLAARYKVVNEALRRYTAQMTPESYTFELPNRGRAALALAMHASTLMRYFVQKYYDDSDDVDFNELMLSFTDQKDAIAAAVETLEIFTRWWERDGFDDPLDAVISTYGGHPTMHEALEREVWHTAQHTRQLMFVLEQLGIQPDGPLTKDDLAGLPLPKRVHE